MRKTVRVRNFYLILILGFLSALLLIHVGQAQVETKGKSPKPPKPSPVPPLSIGDINIATWDFSDTLHIWHRDCGEYGFTDSNKWYKPDCDYNSLTFGDADNDSQKDLVVAGPYTAGRGRNKAWYVCFEVYENGAQEEPSFSSEGVPAGQWFWESEVRVCDLDPGAPNGNEIVLMTSRMFEIYRLTKNGELIESDLLFRDDNNDVSTFLHMDIADLDGDSIPEIVIGTEKGFIRIFKYNGLTWNPVDTVPLGPDPYADYTRIREVKAVDLDGDGLLEILCSTDDYGTSYAPHLHVWKYSDIAENYTYQSAHAVEGVDENTWVYFDAADLDSDPNVEVVIGTFCNYPSEMSQVWRWNNEANSFESIYNCTSSPQVRTRTVSISPVYGSSLQVIISGSNYPENDKDPETFFLEIFDWDGSTLNPLWHAEKAYPTCRHHGVG